MASKLLIPILLGAICMLAVVTARDSANLITMPTATAERNTSVLVIEWPFSYCCPGKDPNSCCLTPWIAADFILHTIWTVNGKGELESNCNGPPFKENQLGDEAYINVYWPSLDCSMKDDQYWKLMWEKYGRCSGLGQNDWFKLAIELFQPNYIVGLNKQGVLPGGKYDVAKYRKGLQFATGHKVEIRCTNNVETGERQLYEVLTCYSQDDHKVIDCNSRNTPALGDYECEGEILLPRSPCKPDRSACHTVA